jgi:hypothetical protein
MLVSVPLASAATRPASPHARSALRIASPGSGLPIIGGFLDSVVGIVTGTVFGVAAPYTPWSARSQRSAWQLPHPHQYVASHDREPGALRRVSLNHCWFLVPGRPKTF